MLDTLRMVYGAVGSRTLLDIMTTFHIYDGRLQAMDGRVVIDAACKELKGVQATVDAERFIRAAEACEGQPDLSIDAGHLVIKRKRFRAKLSLMDSTQFPKASLEVGPRWALKQKQGELLLAALASLRPFVSQDASRPWSMGVLFKAGYAYATNNVLIARVPVEFKIDATCIPVFAVDELLRIGLPPRIVQVAAGTMAFLFDDDWWLRAQTLTSPWPDVDALYAKWPRKLPKVPDGMLDAVRAVAAFVPDVKYPIIKLDAEGVRTLEGQYCASMDGFKFAPATFRVEPLVMMLEVAERCDFAKYPEKCPWEGKFMEGFIIGVRI